MTHEYRSTTGAWTTICTQATSPISCAWNTTSLADGLYDLRTVATDQAGNQTISAPVFNRRVDNTAPTVTITDPGTPLKGTITLASTTGDGNGSGVSSVRYEYKLGAGRVDDRLHQRGDAVLVHAQHGPAAPTASTTSARSPPTASPRSRPRPRSPRAASTTPPRRPSRSARSRPRCQNTVNLTGTATDTGSGIASVRFQYAVAGSGTWSDACTDTTTPTPARSTPPASPTASTTCARSRPTTPATRPPRPCRPTAASTTAAPSSRSPTRSPAASAASSRSTAPRPIPPACRLVTFEYRQGAGAWQLICSDPTASYTCGTIDTNVVADGNYDVRMSATDTLGHQTISPTIVVIIDNTAPTATSVQAANGGTAGPHRRRRHGDLHLVGADGARLDPRRLERHLDADPRARQRGRRRRHARPLQRRRHDAAQRDVARRRRCGCRPTGCRPPRTSTRTMTMTGNTVDGHDRHADQRRRSAPASRPPPT